jgi:S1-C subfamily serine protease
MGRAVIVAVFVIVAVLGAPDWTKTADTLSKSVVFIATSEGTCSGFVINAHAKGDKDYILTAAHCDGKELYADNVPAKVVMKDAKRDLLILEVDDLDRPAVVLAVKNPLLGEEVASFGYGGGLEKPMFRLAHVSHPSIDLPELEGGPFVMIDAGYVGGMSGGPCVNTLGEVVSIVQRASDKVGLGVGVETIRSKVARFLEKPKP